MLKFENMFPSKVKTKATRAPVLGSRELSLLDILWSSEPDSMSAQDVLNKLSSSNTQLLESISINTIQSTLERLVKKDLLDRSKVGRAFFYKTRVPKQQLIGGLIRDIAQDMSRGDMQVMISGFMDFIEAEDPELSGKLGQAISHVVQRNKEDTND